MTFLDVVGKVEKLAADNSPAILTGIGAAGTVITAVLSYRAGLRIGRDLGGLETVDMEVKTTKEFVARYYPEFIPPLITGGVSVAAIVAAHKVGSRRAAAMAAAYSLSEKAYAEYKDKVIERIGKTKEQKVKDEVAQDRVTNNPPTSNSIIVSGGEVLFMDSMSGRYFMSDMETVRKAQNDLNNTVLQHNYASLSDFYDNLDLPRTAFSDEVGWNTDKLLTLQFSTALTHDNRPCIVIDYMIKPIRGYSQLQ